MRTPWNARYRGPAACSVVLVLLPAAVLGQWTQWGGPDRNFVVQTTGLAETWPADGPPRLWKRELGDGFSSIVTDGTRLYTLYRKQTTDPREFVVALDARTGTTIWEVGYASPLPPGEPQFPGPNATPLLLGDRLIAAGVNGVIHCLDSRDGRVLWKRDLLADAGAPVPHWGYSPSPLAYHDRVILPVGRASADGASLVALAPSDGHTLWQAQTFGIGHTSPILIQFAGQDQLVLLTLDGVLGVDPRNGATLWQHPLKTDDIPSAITSPVWIGTDLLYCSFDVLGCVIRLTQKDGQTSAEELWSNRKTCLGMGTPICIGELIVGPRLSQRSFMLAVNARTGEREWYDRACPPGPCIQTDGKLIVLDENGRLALADVSPSGLTVRSQCPVAERFAFTPPTLSGTTLYIRDRQHIMAFDLGKPTLAAGD